MIQLRVTVAILLLMAMLGVVACGNDDVSDSRGPATHTPSPTGDRDDGNDDDSKTEDDHSDDANGSGNVAMGSCDVTVSGGMDVSFSAPAAPETFGADYWMTDSERQLFIRLLGDWEGMSDAEKEQAVEEALADDLPDGMLFLLNCYSPDDGEIGVSLYPTHGDVTYGDVPFGPGTYAIAATESLDKSDFSVLISTGDAFFRMRDNGEVVIEEWTEHRLRGHFAFSAHEQFADDEPRQIDVRGVFDLQR